MQMLRALPYRRENAREVGHLPATCDFRARLRERGNRSERVVELVTQYTDELLPGRELLARQFTGEALEKVEMVGSALKLKRAIGDVERLLDAVHLGAEQAVLA